jgi:chorismate mutase
MASTTLTFTVEGRDRLSKVLDKVGDSAKGLEKKLVMAGAAIPAAAALAPLAAQAGAAAVAVAAFGAAVIPQIGALSDASKAQTKYEDAVAKSGATSEAALTAHVAFQQQIAKMPPASREAAAGLSTLKKQYQGWSDSLAKDTMPVFTKGLAVASAALPKLTPLVKGASTELNRFMTLVAGGVNTSAFDRLSGKFSDFATSSLKRANDGLIHLMRTLDTGKVGGALSQFMDYARAQGPLLAETLKNVGTAALNLLQAASGVGVGLLQLANAAASVVAALPPGFVTVLMQTAIAIRAVRLAGAGIQLLAGGISTTTTAIRGMGTAALGSATRMGSLRLALGTLSTGAKMNLAAIGIGLAVVAIAKLSKLGKEAPPDVDKLSASLVKLTETGKTTGEATRLFGKNMDGLYDSVRNITDPSLLDQIQNGFVKIFTAGQVNSTASDDAQKRLDAIDDSLVKFVQGGNAPMAAAALDLLTAKYAKGGHEAAKFRGQMDEYNKALEDQKFAQEIAAQAQGLFGTQAQKTQVALAAQKTTADGLRQSIEALNDANRSALGGMIGFEASIDAAAKAAKENHGALNMVNGQLDLNSPKAQAAATALNDLTTKTKEAALASYEATGSWEGAISIYDRGRKEFIKNAMAMGLSRKEAQALAKSIGDIPDKTAKVKMQSEDAARDLDAFIGKVQKSPGSKSVTLKTLSKSAEDLLSTFGLKVKRLPDGSVTVTAKTAAALHNLGAVKAARDGLKDKSITITTNRVTKFTSVQGGVTVAKRDYASGGPIGFPGGGPISGPGTGTSDSIPIMASNGEYMINARSTAKYRSLVEAINNDTLGSGRGMPGAGAAVAQGLMSGMAGATSGVGAAARAMAAAVVTGIKDELQIASPSKKTKALAKDVARGFLEGLTGSRDKIKATAKDLATDIKTAFSGKKESGLLKMVDKQTQKLLDAAAKRDKIAATIATAKKYASDVTTAARESAGLSNLGMQPEEVTAGGIKGGLAGKLAQVKAFTKYIDILSKKGLNKSLLRQILNMGPEAGYAYASALVGADKGTFKSINSIQGQLDKATTSLGQVGADRLYDSGKNAGKGFLKGLEGQQKDIEKLMLNIAKGMQKAIKKALGIKSPSTVMAKLGAYSTQGLARGLVDGLPWVDRALDTVTGRVAATRPVLGRAAGAGSSGGMVFHIHVDGTVVDENAVALRIQKALLGLKRHHGGRTLGLA